MQGTRPAPSDTARPHGEAQRVGREVLVRLDPLALGRGPADDAFAGEKDGERPFRLAAGRSLKTALLRAMKPRGPLRAVLVPGLPRDESPDRVIQDFIDDVPAA